MYIPVEPYNKVWVLRPCNRCDHGIVRHSRDFGDHSDCDCEQGYVASEYSGLTDEQMNSIERILQNLTKEK